MLRRGKDGDGQDKKCKSFGGRRQKFNKIDRSLLASMLEIETDRGIIGKKMLDILRNRVNVTMAHHENHDELKQLFMVVRPADHEPKKLCAGDGRIHGR